MQIYIHLLFIRCQSWGMSASSMGGTLHASLKALRPYSFNQNQKKNAQHSGTDGQKKKGQQERRVKYWGEGSDREEKDSDRRMFR